MRSYLPMLPAFCHFYHLQPSEFWRLTNDEFGVLGEYMTEYIRAMEREAR